MGLWCWLVILCGLATAIGGALTFISSYHSDMARRKYLALTIIFAFILVCVLIPKPLQQLTGNTGTPSKTIHSDIVTKEPGIDQNVAGNETAGTGSNIKETAGEAAREANGETAGETAGEANGETAGNNITRPEEDNAHGVANNREVNNGEVAGSETRDEGRAKDKNNPRPAGNTGKVITHVNFRKSPGNNGQIIKVIPAGTTVEIRDTYEPNNWVKVRDMETGQEGWIFGSFVEPVN